MTKKIYVAGPMTGYEYFNFQSFDEHKRGYELAGYEVFSPADHDRMLLGKPEGWMPKESDSVGPWKAWAMEDAPGLRTMLGADLQWICSEATHIVMLPGWEKSNGAQAEWATARALGLEIHYAS